MLISPFFFLFLCLSPFFYLPSQFFSSLFLQITSCPFSVFFSYLFCLLEPFWIQTVNTSYLSCLDFCMFEWNYIKGDCYTLLKKIRFCVSFSWPVKVWLLFDNGSFSRCTKLWQRSLLCVQESQIRRIFSTMISQKLQGFKEEMKPIGEILTQATLELYYDVSSRFLPTPAKIHYLFNLRDISKVHKNALRRVTWHTHTPSTFFVFCFL